MSKRRSTFSVNPGPRPGNGNEAHLKTRPFMNNQNLHRALDAAVTAARAAGKVMRANFNSAKKINEATQHDIKLELYVRCQILIERTFSKSFPPIAYLAQPGTSSNPQSHL